jgi:hypothetical protein
MNCIYCGKPIEEHGEGKETDACVMQALGFQLVNISIQNDGVIERWIRGGHSIHTYYARPSVDYGIMHEVINHLTADDNPVEEVTISWSRSYNDWYIGLEGWYPAEGAAPDQYYRVRADTLPLALCRAVLTLAAVEAGDE